MNFMGVIMVVHTDPECTDGSVADVHIAFHKNIWNSIRLQSLTNHCQHSIPLYNTSAIHSRLKWYKSEAKCYAITLTWG